MLENVQKNKVDLRHRLTQREQTVLKLLLQI